MKDLYHIFRAYNNTNFIIQQILKTFHRSYNDRSCARNRISRYYLYIPKNHRKNWIYKRQVMKQVVMHRRVGSAELSGRFLTNSEFGSFWQRITELRTVRWPYFSTFFTCFAQFLKKCILKIHDTHLSMCTNACIDQMSIMMLNF